MPPKNTTQIILHAGSTIPYGHLMLIIFPAIMMLPETWYIFYDYEIAVTFATIIFIIAELILLGLFIDTLTARIIFTKKALVFKRFLSTKKILWKKISPAKYFSDPHCEDTIFFNAPSTIAPTYPKESNYKICVKNCNLKHINPKYGDKNRDKLYNLFEACRKAYGTPP